MKILALEPYYDGSHKAFLDCWAQNSIHDWTVIGLPGYHWKWRMHHAPVTFAQQLKDKAKKQYDLLFCSDMLNLPEFLGICPKPIRELPSVIYFHENQLTYPVQVPDERDYHYGMINIKSAYAAPRVWFNSKYHRDCFLTEAAGFLNRMPDYNHENIVESIAVKSEVVSPLIDDITVRDQPRDKPLTVLWSSRWEYDKNPEDFYRSLKLLDKAGIDFNLNIIGQSFNEIPEVFDDIKASFGDRIKHWGYQKYRDDYLKILADSDIIVSTAIHEFFGIGVVEAMAAGVIPILPNRLSYPEILNGSKTNLSETCLYDGSPENLYKRIETLVGMIKADSDRKILVEALSIVAKRFNWKYNIAAYDKKLEDI